MGGRFLGGPTMLTTMTEEDWTIVLKGGIKFEVHHH